MSYLRKNFCDCCEVMYHRPKRLIRSGSQDELCMQITGMCMVCYEETNPIEKRKKEEDKFTKSES